MLKWLIDYLVNNLGIQSNAAATIILSIFTFSLGFLITWIASALSRWIARIKYKRSLKIIITSFLESCKIQYLALNQFSTQKGFLHDEAITVNIKSNFAQTYLSNIDIKVFIENFSLLFNKSRAQEISDLFEQVESVKFAKETLKEQMKLYYQTYEENLNKYNENMDGLRKIQDDLALEYHRKEIGKDLDKELAEYIYSISGVFNTWRANGGNISIYATNTEIVAPLFDTAISKPPNRISRKIIENCLHCKVAVDNINNVRKYMNEEVERLRTSHKVAYEKGTAIFNKW